MSFLNIQKFRTNPKRVDLSTGDHVYVMPLMASAYLAVQKMDQSESLEGMAHIIFSTVVSEDGKPVFQNRDEVLNTLPTELLIELSNHVLKATGLIDEDKIEKKD